MSGLLTSRASAPPILRPYQVEAVEKVERAFAGGSQAPLLALATGAGKTVIAGEIIRRWDGNVLEHCKFHWFDTIKAVPSDKVSVLGSCRGHIEAIPKPGPSYGPRPERATRDRHGPIGEVTRLKTTVGN